MELSEEEKKAIEWLEKANYFSARLYAPTILNLIEKQQKEIEEKSTILLAGAEKVKQLEKEIEELKEKNAQLTNYLNDSYYVSADKIREILKDLEEFDTNFFNASTLKEAIKNSLNNLLEENK